MCGYSLDQYGAGTRGFAPTGDRGVAVCLLPGTELAFDHPVNANVPLGAHCTAVFRQVNKTIRYTHHDALELPNGQMLLLTQLAEAATVLQLPIKFATAGEADAQNRMTNLNL